jgi:hypothetical protein
MDKRKITAKDMLRDIRSGLSDQDLMEKHTLSAQGLQSVFHKLVTAGVVTQAELDDRVPITERTVDLGLYICPACGNIQGTEFTTCPRCGFIAPGRGKAVQEERPAISQKKTSAAPARPQRTDSRISAKREAGPPYMHKEEPASGQLRNQFPDLTRLLAYCRVLGIAALVSYILAAAGIIILQGTGSSTESSLIGLSLLGIPAVAIAVIVFVALRALAESIEIFASIAGASLRNLPSKE